MIFFNGEPPVSKAISNPMKKIHVSVRLACSSYDSIWTPH